MNVLLFYVIAAAEAELESVKACAGKATLSVSC
jgi:hypothetical protein